MAALVIVTGSRKWRSKKEIHAALDHALIMHGVPLTVYFGCADGADHMAEEWAINRSYDGQPVVWRKFRALWDTHGKAAGVLRNQQMLESAIRWREMHPDEPPVVCLAFPTKESRGTWDMIRRCVAAGVPTSIHPPSAAPASPGTPESPSSGPSDGGSAAVAGDAEPAG